MKAPLPVNVNAMGKTTIATRAIRVERFTAESVKDPRTLAEQLNRVQNELVAATLHARTNPMASAMTYTGLALPASGNVTITHGLGHPAQWLVVRWRDNETGAATTTAPSLVEDVSSTPSVLVLRSGASGRADLMVW